MAKDKVIPGAFGVPASKVTIARMVKCPECGGRVSLRNGTIAGHYRTPKDLAICPATNATPTR